MNGNYLKLKVGAICRELVATGFVGKGKTYRNDHTSYDLARG